MKEGIHNVFVIYYNTTPELDNIRYVLGHAGINARLIPFDQWIDVEFEKQADALILIFDKPPCSPHSTYTVLDFGMPVLMLHCYGRDHPPSVPQNCEGKSWTKDKAQLLEWLRQVNQKSRPLPLHLPTVKGMEKLNPLAIFGASSSFVKVAAELYKFSSSRAPVLIQGETGTGKELGARALHYLGLRREGPFIPVNCSSLPDSLFENEVFGHSKGAYTDARESYTGLVEQAEGGTLFLDEVDSLEPRAQASLLRYLQDKKYRPLGSTKFIAGQTSIVAATNQNLNALVSEGKFREDLLYRINTVTITFPPLRERPEDITLLARVFLRKLCEQYAHPPKSFHPDTLNWLEKQPWPGNVRQLENCIHREFLLSETPFIRIDDLKRNTLVADNPCVYLPVSMTDFHFNETRNVILQDFEQQFLHRLMLATHGNVSQASRLAGKERRCLGKLLKKYEINREDYLE